MHYQSVTDLRSVHASQLQMLPLGVVGSDPDLMLMSGRNRSLSWSWETNTLLVMTC